MITQATEQTPIVDIRRGLLACLEAIEQVDRHLVEEATSDYLRSVEKSRRTARAVDFVADRLMEERTLGADIEPRRGQVVRLIDSHIKRMKDNLVDDTVRAYVAPALGCVSVPELNEALFPLIDKLKDTEFGEIVTFDHPPTELRDMLIDRFASVGYFRGSETSVRRVYSPYVTLL